MKIRGSLVLLLAAFAACSGEKAWTPLAADALAGPQAAQLTKAGLARDGLGKALLAELTEGLKQGPAPAITVCSERAPVLAAEKAKEFGVRIGRTSRSLRNPANGAPEWAKQHVAGGAAAPAYFAGPGGEFGALFPIQLQPQCVQCHGKPAELAAEVKDVLAKKYPQDRATGFAAGDLRGWFWVEVPKGE
jgi:hypothetical protein